MHSGSVKPKPVIGASGEGTYRKVKAGREHDTLTKSRSKGHAFKSKKR